MVETNTATKDSLCEPDVISERRGGDRVEFNEGPQPGSWANSGFGYVYQQLLSSSSKLSADLFAILVIHGYALMLQWPADALLKLSVFSSALIFAFWLSGQYPGVGVHPAIALRRVATTITIVSLCMIVFRLLGPGNVSVSFFFQLVGIWLILLTVVPISRYLSSQIFQRFDWWAQPVLIIGNDETAEYFYRTMLSSRVSGLRPYGIAVHSHHQWKDDFGNPDWIKGTLEDIHDIRDKNGLFWVLNTMREPDAEDQKQVEYAEQFFPHRLTLTSAHRNGCSLWVDTVSLGRFTLIHQIDRLMLPLHQITKRSCDVMLSTLAVLILSPLFLGLILVVKLTSKGPALYRSPRVGGKQDEFEMLKFRTMYENGDEILSEHFRNYPEQKSTFESEAKLPNDPRVTPVGDVLRRTSLDELPQLFDVLLGKMSMVGPRPMLPSEKEKYGEVLRDYSRVLPGITGMWQISGRNNTTYEERLAYVEYYIQNWSVWLDVCVLAKTFLVVVKKEGAY